MPESIITKSAFAVYDIGWRMARPLLRLNKRLAVGFDQRVLKQMPPAADIWIQAASVGESFLAWELLKHWRPQEPPRILLTTNTQQGMEILEKAVVDIGEQNGIRQLNTAYFPFDQPRIMQRAVAHIRPRIMLLLESEMWPAHLAALKDADVPVLLVNGRITEKSLRAYLHWRSLWQRLRPDQILAVSEDDARRFGELFGSAQIAVMPNIKFDRLKEHTPEAAQSVRQLSAIIPADKPLVVFGSVREQEETAVREIIEAVRRRHPSAITALFPRHHHRLAAWTLFLDKQRLPWQRRSHIEKPLDGGAVVLWDTFGELAPAYSLATAAFVGGSLAPLGGQNFLEPLISGVRPVIGPYWETFQWVGSEIMEQGLVRVAADWRAAADILCTDISQPASKDQVRRDARRYIQSRRGGTAAACRLIDQYLQTTKAENNPAAPLSDSDLDH